ncbi:hypothetical protein M1N64_04265 [Peptococcaceae bacterium]|nr:hypothetical protein [Peptococcaceae bacterium]
MKIVEGIAKLKNISIEINISNQAVVKSDQGTVSLVANKPSLLTTQAKMPEDMTIKSIKDAQKQIRMSQIQLFQYILLQCHKQNNKNIILNISDYFKIRGLKRKKENVDRFIQDLSILAHIKINIKGNNHGKISLMNGDLITIKGRTYLGNENKVVFSAIKGKKLCSFQIVLGRWADELKINQSVLLYQNFFQYRRENEMALLISLKLSQLCAVNYKKMKTTGYYKLKTRNLLDFIGIDEQKVKKQGQAYYRKKITNAFQKLSKEGYVLKLDKLFYKSTHDFLESYLRYQNKDITDFYMVYKKRKTKKKIVNTLKLA